VKTIEITISADGKVEVETKGYSGQACLVATDDVERALGKQGRTVVTPEAWTVRPVKEVKR
jgi:predicted RNA-binding protein YlqC (UPF0109 family)